MMAIGDHQLTSSVILGRLSWLAFIGMTRVLSGGQKRSGSNKGVDNQQGGYATNFGASLGGAGSRGIEGQLVACVFKALVSRFVKANRELKNPENMVRKQISLVLENSV
ncbi:Protein unc-80 [Portunus trituberculatus]|uniref:Protein unc-80 n=1 Tax=Portunus trituberculatus TaxID=210409 RepID=A0A5B7KHQ2_PORTR|nr:Protein unc-80 [Portunus trituberculatus]